MRNIILFTILSLAASSLPGQTAQRDELLGLVTKYGQAEITFPYPGYNELTDLAGKISVSTVRDGIVYAVLSSNDIDTFLEQGISFKIVPEDDTKSVVSALSVAEAMNWDRYPTYQQYDSIMRRFAEDWPAICRLDTIGFSIEGRLILALKISDNVSVEEDEPEVFYTSTIHGDELAGFVLMLRLAEHLLQNSSNGGIEERLIDSLEIWINPLSNPDGTYYGGDTITNPRRYNSTLKDLNRTFPDPLSPSIVPPPENVAMISFMRERNFVLSANFHSGAEVLNFPWDRWLSRIPADSVWFNYICRRYADTVHNYSPSSYLNDLNDGVTRGAVWYSIVGGRQDFVTYELQGREVTIELDLTKQTDAAQLPVLWEYNRRSFLMYLENAMFGVHGIVSDMDSGFPVEAKIYIAGYDTDSSHVYSDPQTGSFTRMLSEGTYDLAISADGYYPVVIPDVPVLSLQQTRINVALQSIASGFNDISEEKLHLWPVPAGRSLNILLPEGITGNIAIGITSVNGSTYRNMVLPRISSEPLTVDVSGIPPGLYFCTFRETGSGRIFTCRFVKQ